MNLVERIRASVKAFRQQETESISGWPRYVDRRFYWEPGTNLDYDALVGDLWTNSAVQSVINWLWRAWPESYPCVKRKDGEKKVVDDTHPIAYMLESPNPGHDDTVLWAGTILSYWCDGNAYWGINRNGMQEPVEFVYLPHSKMKPKRDKGSMNPGPDFYEYTLEGKPERIPVADVVHYRFGMNPTNTLLGMSAWASVNRHVYLDNQAAHYANMTLKNGGASWMILTPEEAGAGFGTQVEAESIKKRVEQATMGDSKSRVLMLDGNVKPIFPPSMKEQDLGGLHRIPETRIAALAGIPAITLGFASGLERSTFENTDQADAAAWRTIVAVQRMMGRQATQQLLRRPENFEDKTRTFFVGFDYSEVRALQPDKTTEHERIRNDYEAGLLTEDEAREEMGRDPFTPAQKTEIEEARAVAMEARQPQEDEDEAQVRKSVYAGNVKALIEAKRAEKNGKEAVTA